MYLFIYCISTMYIYYVYIYICIYIYIFHILFYIPSNFQEWIMLRAFTSSASTEPPYFLR